MELGHQPIGALYIWVLLHVINFAQHVIYQSGLQVIQTSTVYRAACRPLNRSQHYTDIQSVLHA